MAKSLGQIHTVNYELGLAAPIGVASGETYLIDLPGQLTQQLQHMVRAMNSFKLVGIDMAVAQPVGSPDPIDVAMEGSIKYFAPTQGRCAVLVMAYTSVRRMMKLSGVKPTNAISYDFRPCIIDPATPENGGDFHNQAAIEDNGLATCIVQGPAGTHSIFGLYNQGIIPRDVVGAITYFEEGFDIGLRTNVNSADWVLNEETYLGAQTKPLASEEMEEIPFNLTYNSIVAPVAPLSGTAVATPFQWRPDPALYLSILTGQLLVEFNQVDIEGEADEVLVNAAFHVAGWKSILGGGRKRRLKKGKKSHGRKRRSRK